MVFLDLWYLVFVPFALAAAWLLPQGWRVSAVLFLCFVFHWHYAGPAGMKPILLLSVAVYASLRLKKYQSWAGIACLLAWLFYAHPELQSTLGVSKPWAAPLAISFFTFEFLHLLIDSAYGRLQPLPRFRDYLFFILFFPSLASGPIKRFQQFQPQLRKLGWPGKEEAARATARLVWGFFMKLVVSSWFSALLPSNLHAQPYGSTFLLALYCYFYVSVDLTSYSHIAIASAKLLGVNLPENVRNIYVARSFSDFWSRWHMSVTQWFRDYVLWPAAGQSGARWRFYAAIGLTMFLTSLWHGSGLHVVLWAAIHALAVVIETAGSRTKAWKRLCASSAGPFLPWIQWTVFQICLILSTLLLFYPLDQVAAQFLRGL